MNNQIQALVNEINKVYGEETILLGSEIDYSLMSRIPSGSLALDVALGGGWPVGVWHEIYGNESDGKTMLVLKTIAENQRLNPEWTAVWIASEDFVSEWAEQLGCDLERIVVVDTQVMEQAYEVAIRFLDSKAVDCVVVDSLPALVPGEEAEKTMVDFQVGLGARLTGKFFRKARGGMKRSLTHAERPVTGFMINQFREKIGVMYGDNRTTPGGKAKNFHYFSRVEVKRVEWIQNTKMERFGQRVKCRTVKNKTHPPQKTAEVDFYFTDYKGFKAGEYDRAKDILGAALRFDVFRQAGAWYYWRDERWQGAGKLLESLREDYEMQESVAKEVLSSMKGGLPLVAQEEAVPAKRVVRRKK